MTLKTWLAVAGATAEDGSRAENVFCLTTPELQEFYGRIVGRCVEVLVTDIDAYSTKDKYAEAIKFEMGIK